jgi:hypothetical protein
MPSAWTHYLKWFYQPDGLQPYSNAEAEINWTAQFDCIVHGTPDGRFEAASSVVENLRSLGLDFIVDFSGLALAGPLLEIPTFGVWSLKLDSSPSTAHYPVGIGATYRQATITTAELHRLTNSGPAVVLKRGTFRTELDSPTTTADRLYKECAHWPADLCRQLLGGVDLAPVSGQSAHSEPAVADLGSHRVSMSRFLGLLAKHKLRNVWETFFQADQWNMGVVQRPVQDFLRPESLRKEPVDAPMLPDRHVFYADCFARQEDTGSVVYFERYDYRVRRGTIARLHYPWRPAEEPTDVLSFPFHLSYPFLIGPYCMPEAWITNGIRLYDMRQPVNDPAAGQLLLAVQGVDSTLLEHEGRFWLFYARMDRDPMLNLFIAYADALTGPWHEHPQNPVKTDIRSARPAGPFFREGQRLYRPAQDCARDYGYGITINEVLTLTTTEYAECEVTHLTSPHPDYPDGMHTIAALDEHRTIVDFKRRRFIPFATLSAFWKPVSSLIYGKQGRRRLPVVEAVPTTKP